MRRSKKEWMINRELKLITENIPRELLENLMKEEEVAPTLTKLIEKAIALPNGEKDMNDEKRERFRNLLASGVMDRTVQVIDRDKESLIEAYFEAEIAHAVKMGRLPKEAPIPDFIKRKGKKYARKQADHVRSVYEANASAPEGSTEGIH